ncbi:hypothetical protein SAY86_028235 [Trapa natans]|uniref:Uncharacterized protein n=1 Tax=Trapa natans TaxID=22666 RepID=A0AAN7M0B2_TRANT|nr:hypothetical protein SAY86_028235 [Trapa natans]
MDPTCAYGDRYSEPQHQHELNTAATCKVDTRRIVTQIMRDAVSRGNDLFPLH